MLGYRFKVGKLIRDKLPSIMRDQGLRIFEHSMDDEAFEAALRAKLIEEAAEAQSAQTRTDLAHELADCQRRMLKPSALKSAERGAVLTDGFSTRL